MNINISQVKCTWNLQNELNELLETLPAHYDQGRIWFQQDEAAAHYSQAVKHYLDDRFPNR